MKKILFILITILIGCSPPAPPMPKKGPLPWPQGRIPYQIMPGNFSMADQINITRCMKEWTDATGGAIEFTPYKVKGTQTLRIYRLIRDQEQGGEGYSLIGYNPDQYEAVLLSNTSRPVVLHEFGHVLGLEHEHQRPDRGRYIGIRIENIPPGAEFEFTEMKSPELYDYRKYPYDMNSIMHYHCDNGGGRHIGGYNISEIDARKVRDIYSKR